MERIDICWVRGWAKKRVISGKKREEFEW